MVFLAEDDRIKLIRNTENIGVGLSRKKAIEQTTGEYIMFLDGDDYLDVISLAKPSIMHNAETTA
ncbi:MAG: glycosyltransferase [Butyricicoccaceae bacterium]